MRYSIMLCRGGLTAAEVVAITVSVELVEV